MDSIYFNYRGPDVDRLGVHPSCMGGVKIHTNGSGCLLPDEEIPGLISTLQAYMSRRAKEITRAAREAAGVGHYHDPLGKYDYCADPACRVDKAES